MLYYQHVTGPRAAVRVMGPDDGAINPRAFGGFVALDPYTGKVVNADYLPGRQTVAYTTVSSFFALHFGSYGGEPTRWLYFVLALAGCWLFYSGNLLWIASRDKRKDKDSEPAPPRRDVRLMRAATVGVCLGCVSGISLTLAAGKWLPGHAGDLLFWHQFIYYAVFFASIGWAFWRGARASADLLWLAAAATLAIPLTSLPGWIFPAPGPWAHPATWGVDAAAFVSALCFAGMARGVDSRLKTSGS
jgi:hypothetical protein